MLTLYADGSCEPNPGLGGWAWYCVETGQRGYGNDPSTTNNRMEMQAILAALESLPTDAHAVIRSDSQLCINQLTKGWKAKANAELVQQALAASKARLYVRFEWVRGHAGEKWNEYADALANGARLGVMPLCPHITDPELVDFYEHSHPELTCARCWLEGT